MVVCIYSLLRIYCLQHAHILIHGSLLLLLLLEYVLVTLARVRFEMFALGFKVLLRETGLT